MIHFFVIRALIQRIPFILRLLLIVIGIASVIGSIIHLLEPKQFPSLFDGIWWAIVTVSTVGYGDFVPVSTFTRLIAIALIFIGIGFMTLLVTSFATSAVSAQQLLREGGLSFMGKEHVIIIGWNERSNHAIQNLQKEKPMQSIVLIDETLEQLPTSIFHRHLHFIKGNSSEDTVLKQANIGFASSVLITARHEGSEFSTDARSILTTLAVRSHSPNTYIIVEILTKEQMENARRAGADEIIASTTLTGAVLINSLLYHHLSDVLDDLLKFDKINQLIFYPVRTELVGLAFSDVMSHLYHEQLLLIGLKRDENILLHPEGSLIVKTEDELIVIKKINN
ncbi:potassium channel family protein [Bacillus solitudinis]|uniref:potassium channel family protein n=1 Tax=Bacillus solitudinis TaxID=2014074 RepID=UPI000C2461FC|nr:potassium channel protein [Bacillus solitudinis]